VQKKHLVSFVVPQNHAPYNNNWVMFMIDKPIYAIRLAQLRNAKGMTQEQLASLAQLTRGRLNNYEQGIREPDIETLKSLAKLFNCSTDYLIGLSDNRHLCSPDISNQINIVKKHDNPEKEEAEFLQKMKNLPLEKRRAIEIMVMSDEQFTKQR
jgi:transcriptional regulator with XRE-family HTH domain